MRLFPLLILLLGMSANAIEVRYSTKKVEILNVYGVSVVARKTGSGSDKLIISIATRIESNLCTMRKPKLSVGTDYFKKSITVYATGDTLTDFLSVDGCAQSSSPMDVAFLVGLGLNSWDQKADYKLNYAYGSKDAIIRLVRDRGEVKVLLSSEPSPEK